MKVIESWGNIECSYIIFLTKEGSFEVLPILELLFGSHVYAKRGKTQIQKQEVEDRSLGE